MKKLAVFPDLTLAREQAAEWIARMDRGLNAAEQAEFRRWRANPANARALQDLSALWGDLDVMQALADVFPDSDGARPADAARGDASRHLPRGRLRMALAASVVIGVALAAGVAYLVGRETHPDAQQVAAARVSAFATAVGEQRTVPLADGSMLALNTDSLVEVSLGEQSRELRLVRGEVHFTVSHDPSRPFRVDAEGRIVQAVGTAFNVRLHTDHNVEVIVTDGRVKVLADPGGSTAGSAASPVLADRLDPGQALWIGADGSTRATRLDGAALASRLAWQNGTLVFDGQTLEAVLAEYSRYTSERFVATDTAVRQLRIGGYFPVGDTEALLEMLRANFGLEVVRGANGAIHIGPGHGPLTQ